MKTTGTFSSLIFSVMMIASVLNLPAQTREFKISPFRFAGVHSLSSVKGYSDAFMVVHAALDGDWNFQLLDNNLSEIKTGKIDAPRHSFFNGMTCNGDHTLMNFVVNFSRPSITYVILDAKGNEIARTTRTDVPLLRRGDQFFPGVYNHPANGFLIIQSAFDGKQAGYTIEHVDNKLNTLWSRTFSRPKGHAHVYDLVSEGNRVFILEATERMGRTLNARLHSLDAETGAHIYTMELSDDNFAYFPTALLPLENNGVALAGSYYKGDKIRGRKSQGLFFLNVEGNGETSGMNLHAWKGLRKTLRTPVPDWFFKLMPDVYIHALELNADGSYIAVAELYRYSGEVSREKKDGNRERYHRIRLLDFMLIGFDSFGNIPYTDRIERPHMVLKLDADFSGGSGSLAENAGKGPLRRARAMKKAGAFTYRFHQFSEHGFNMAFMSYENKMHYAYLMDLNHNYNAVKVDLRHAKPGIISYLQIVDLCTDQSGYGFILSELNTRSFDDSEAYWRGVLPSTENRMLVYEYMPLTGKLKMSIVELPSLSAKK